MPETLSATEIKEHNLDTVLAYRDDNLQLDHAKVVGDIVSSGGPVCDGCSPKSLGRAATLAAFAEIGTISIVEAGDRLAEFNQAVCTHLGTAALYDMPMPELVSA